MTIRTALAAAMLTSTLGLNGCAVGIVQGDAKALSGTATLPIGYQEAHRRAEAHARACHQNATNLTSDSFAVASTLYTDNRTGVVRVTYPGRGTELEIIEVTAIDEAKTFLVVREWGRGIVFDEGELAAVRTSVETGVPTCG